ncbi:predicted protein [Nematostella vectensis]|uniref:Protein phosphatase 1 regulatory subunit 15A/B C-terminal domain-containing protein n=1 Tax=Nematostella vectensis TaxID=45351 RepID=A7RH49_NEMVE|nr:uncharacterized protein LOC5521436 [Nematostella vectensis]EDO49160.1 predicted protein [Nematostella vectensis]|eukprot:XP_001641223.1 predicted protein [Nematostella vectensis]
MFEQLFDGVVEMVVGLWAIWSLPLLTRLTQQFVCLIKGITIAHVYLPTKDETSVDMNSYFSCCEMHCTITANSNHCHWKTWTDGQITSFAQSYNQKLHGISQNTQQSICSFTRMCETTTVDSLKQYSPESRKSCPLACIPFVFKEFDQSIQPTVLQQHPLGSHTKNEASAVSEKIHNCKDMYSHYLEKVTPKKQENMNFSCFNEKSNSSAASIDSGYRSHQSVESNCKCIDEDGVTLYVSDCCYDRQGRLIRMYVGLSEYTESTSESYFEDEDSSAEDDSDVCNEDDEDEDFIVFDSHTWCPVYGDKDQDFTFISIQVTPAFSMSDGDFNSNSKEYHKKCKEISEENFVGMTLNNINSQGQEFNYDDDKYLNVNDSDYDNTDSDIDFDNPTGSDIDSTKDKSIGAGTGTKKVKFCEEDDVHVMYTWDFAYRAARRSEWCQCATDREHFKLRINQTEQLLKPVLLDRIAKMQET